jgi:hypothetical protein
MTPRTLFTIVLKIIGVLFIKDILVTIPELVSVFFYLTKADTAIEGIWTAASAIVIITIYCCVAYLFIFKTDIISEKLKLANGFDQESIPVNIHRSTVLSISVIVIGGLLIADQVPQLCRQLYLYFKEKRMTRGQTDPDISYSVLAASKILVGLLLILNQRIIVNFVERKRVHQNG